MPKSYKTAAALKMLFTFTIGSIPITLCVQAAMAQGTSVRDDFNTFDSSMWIKSDHVLGRTDFDPENVAVSNSQLRLNIPASTTGGAEIESMEYYGCGTYKARIRTTDAPSSITGFYLYRSPDLYAEIDIEVYNNGTGEVDFVTYADGQGHTMSGRTFASIQASTSIPTASTTNRGGEVLYRRGPQADLHGIPQDSMKLLVNNWFPSWLEGNPPRTARVTRVDWISYERM